MRKNKSAGISLPNEVIQKIDYNRGDISRSRYLLRIVEEFYQLKEKVNEK